MILIRKLPQWSGTPYCQACGYRGWVRVTTVNPHAGTSASLVLCDGCEASLTKKLDAREKQAALKQLGVKSTPWKPGK